MKYFGRPAILGPLCFVLRLSESVGVSFSECRAQLSRLVLWTLRPRTRRWRRANHRHTGFAAPRRSKLPARNPLLMALQESVGGLGRPLDLLLAPIRCRRPWPRCCLIRPQHQCSHHSYRRRQLSRYKSNPYITIAH